MAWNVLGHRWSTPVPIRIIRQELSDSRPGSIGDDNLTLNLTRRFYAAQ